MKTHTSESGFKLLTIGNAKTVKGEELGILTGILYLNPAVTDKLCPFASSHCRELCLVQAGRAEFIPAIMVARTRKTNEFLNNRAAFIDTLKSDIRKLERKAQRKGMKAAVRLNGTSDILWERFIDFAEFPNVQFYDYTKIPLRHRRRAANYHLTFSFSGTNAIECSNALAQGVNVAMVFAKSIPSEYQGHKVIDGTTHDVRFMDNRHGVIVGLCAKGRKAKLAAKNGSPFIVKN